MGTDGEAAFEPVTSHSQLPTVAGGHAQAVQL